MTTFWRKAQSIFAKDIHWFYDSSHKPTSLKQGNHDKIFFITINTMGIVDVAITDAIEIVDVMDVDAEELDSIELDVTEVDTMKVDTMGLDSPFKSAFAPTLVEITHILAKSSLA